MERPRYLPANRAKAAGLRLGRLSVRTGDGREIGKLRGFVIDTAVHKIRSLVVESGESILEVAMAPVQFDAATRSLFLVDSGNVKIVPFSPEAVPHVEVEDLWVPLMHTAA